MALPDGHQEESTRRRTRRETELLASEDEPVGRDMGTRAEAASEGHPRRPPPALSPAAGPRRWTCASEVTSWDVAPPRALGESRPQTGSARDPPAEPAAPRATGASSPGPPARAPHAGWLKRRGCVVPWPLGARGLRGWQQRHRHASAARPSPVRVCVQTPHVYQDARHVGWARPPSGATSSYLRRRGPHFPLRSI